MQEIGAMTGREERNDSAGKEEEELQEGPFCSSTNRIVMISPLPQRIHLLIRGLAAACYDVLMFHQADPALLARLQIELLIIDRTAPAGLGQLDWLEQPEFAGLTVLQLVGPGHGGEGAADGTIVWPSTLVDVMSAIRSALGSVREVSRTSDEPASAGLPSDVLRLKELTLDLKRHTVVRGGQRVDLTKTEFDLLKTLLEAGGSVLSRQELMDRVWGASYYGGSNTVDVHMKALRRKLADNPKEPRYIATVRGIGYRLAD